VLLSLRTKLPFDLLDSWKPLREKPIEEQLTILRDPELRQPYVDAAVNANYATFTGIGAAARPPDFEGIKVYLNGLPPNPSVADVAREQGLHPAEAMINLCVASDGYQVFQQPSLFQQD